jgi:hypothetical protein
MGNVVRKTYRETPENKLAFRDLEKKVILSLGPCAQIEGSPNSFFVYYSDKPIPKEDKGNYLFAHVNINNKIISVKNRKYLREAEELAYKINPVWDWTLEESYFD